MDPTSPSKRILTGTTCKLLCKATASYPDMKLLEHHFLHGWSPSQEHLPLQPQAFWHFCEELAVADGILLKSTCAIVPFACSVSQRQDMLNKIYHSHGGGEYYLLFTQDAIFWPSMSKDIDKVGPLINTQSTPNIRLTKADFASRCIPLCCLTDNGLQFILNK